MQQEVKSGPHLERYKKRRKWGQVHLTEKKKEKKKGQDSLICEVTESDDSLAYEVAVDGEVESFRNSEMGARKTLLDTEADDERDYEGSIALAEQSWINGKASAEDATAVANAWHNYSSRGEE